MCADALNRLTHFDRKHRVPDGRLVSCDRKLSLLSELLKNGCNDRASSAIAFKKKKITTKHTKGTKKRPPDLIFFLPLFAFFVGFVVSFS